MERGSREAIGRSGGKYDSDSMGACGGGGIDDGSAFGIGARGVTRRDREVVDFTRSRVKNNTELTNLGN